MHIEHARSHKRPKCPAHSLNMRQSDISCIILAGGKGRRVRGMDKGLLEYRDKLLIEHVIDRIAPQVDDIIISANRNLEAYRSFGYPVVSDSAYPFQGPLSGISSTLPHCRHQWALVVPCDMPALPDDLVAMMRKHTGQAKLIAVCMQNRLQLILLMHCTLASTIHACLAHNQLSVMDWLVANEAFVLSVDNENNFRNINTMNQLLK